MMNPNYKATTKTGGVSGLGVEGVGKHGMNSS